MYFLVVHIWRSVFWDLYPSMTAVKLEASNQNLNKKCIFIPSLV